jgi:hypothetical protein
LGERDMSNMRRIEGPAENAETQRRGGQIQSLRTRNFL